jgi:hypothetical protein
MSVEEGESDGVGIDLLGSIIIIIIILQGIGRRPVPVRKFNF